MSETLRFEAGEDADGQRLDRFLGERVADRSRSALAKACSQGLVRVDGRVSAASRKLRPGQVVEAQLPQADAGPLRAEAIPLSVLHEDESVLVLDKASGLVVHPGAGVREGTLVNALLHHLGEGLAGVGAEGRPGLVHRLDRGTSGVMVVAKTAQAHAELSRQFAAREVEKDYLALVLGAPKEEEGLVDAPIGRSSGQRTRMSVRGDGRTARSRWRVRESFGRHAAWLEVRIETGRTHQVRVHLAHVGLPLAGDRTYGGRRDQAVAEPRVRALLTRFARPALHAWRLSFTHPSSGERLAFEAPLPEDLAALLERLRALFEAR